ncbi:MAG: hypothetical protein U1E70_21665 [Acetobacteraceae bacterium]
MSLVLLTTERNHTVHTLHDALLQLTQFVHDAAPAIVAAANHFERGLQNCNLPASIYAALAAVLLVKLYVCRKEHKPEHAQECAVDGLAGALLALAYLLRHG